MKDERQVCRYQRNVNQQRKKWSLGSLLVISDGGRVGGGRTQTRVRGWRNPYYKIEVDVHGRVPVTTYFKREGKDTVDKRRKMD